MRMDLGKLSGGIGRGTTGRRAGGEQGLTLIDVLIAIFIFMVIATAIAGTLAAGLQSTVGARLSSLGKAQADRQLEEMRAKPYYVPYSTDTSVGTTFDADLLDFYYPNVSSAHVTDSRSWTGWYTSSGSDAWYTTVSPPDQYGITTTVETRFISNTGQVVIPPATYDSNSADNDRPASNLVSVSIATSWHSRGNPESYTLDSMISSAVRSQIPENGCLHSSNSTVDVIGGNYMASAGLNSDIDLDTVLVSGTLGESKAATTYGCTTILSASGTAGDFQVLGVTGYQGANAAVAGPPDATRNAGPTTINTPLLNWPQLSFGSSASAQVSSSPQTGGYEAQAAGTSSVSGLEVGLGQVSLPFDTSLLGDLFGYQAWSFTNPVMHIHGTGQPIVNGSLEQENGRTVGETQVAWPQIDILPLDAATLNTPSASQGLIFIRNFTATSNSAANGIPGGAYSSLTYSATVGMFDPTKPAGCSGDDCYDLYPVSGPNPDVPIQTAIALSSDSRYSLQSSLLTQFTSATSTDISNALFTDPTGTKASVSMDALIRVQSQFGLGVKRQTSTASVSLVELQGLVQLKIGNINVSIQQNQ